MTHTRLSSYSRGGLTFDVSDSGPLDGPTVVLLHGFPANRHSFDDVVPILNAAGIRTLAPDQRGYSDRARPRRRRDYRSAELQRDVLELVNASGAGRVHLVGHDWGGALAWQLGSSAPERLTGITVLSTPHPAAMVRSLVCSAQALRSFYVLVFQVPLAPELVLRPRLARLLRRMGLNPTAAARYGEFMRTGNRLSGGLHWYRGLWLPDGRAPRSRAVQIRTTYVWGNRDQALGRRAAELSRRFVRAPYRFVELDENHWLPEHAPERVASEIIADVLP
jgi:pimeloyl-ACP methyl ester carboxylesterase